IVDPWHDFGGCALRQFVRSRGRVSAVAGWGGGFSPSLGGFGDQRHVVSELFGHSAPHRRRLSPPRAPRRAAAPVQGLPPELGRGQYPLEWQHERRAQRIQSLSDLRL